MQHQLRHRRGGGGWADVPDSRRSPAPHIARLPVPEGDLAGPLSEPRPQAHARLPREFDHEGAGVGKRQPLKFGRAEAVDLLVVERHRQGLRSSTSQLL